MTDSGWHLVRIEAGTNGAKVNLRGLRPLTVDDYSQFRGAQAMLLQTNDHHLIGPVVDSLNAALDLYRAVVADPNVSRGPEAQARSKRIAGDYLGELSSFRRRLERLADDQFPASSPELHARFQALWLSHPQFRLCWEIRNQSEHGGDPLDHTIVSSFAETEWLYNVGALTNSHRGEKDWDHLATLWTIPLVRIDDLYWSAFNGVERTYHEWIAAQSLAIEAAASLFEQLHSEGAPTPGDATAIMQIRPPKIGEPIGSIPVTGEQVDLNLAAYSLGTVQAAKAALGL